MENPKTVAEYDSRAQAELAGNTLRSYDIKCLVLADDLGGVRPDQSFIQGVRVVVDEDDFDEAAILLNVKAITGDT